MGCAASSRIQPHPAQVAEDQKARAEFERQLAKARAAQEANTNAALRFGQQFELTTPIKGRGVPNQPWALGGGHKKGGSPV